MYLLENSELRVEILDPVADADRQGTRYCWGGYIWQVHDRLAGPLLSGPEWPEPRPTSFNGQGLPESFRHRTRDGRPLTWVDKNGVGLGTGALAVDAQDLVTITERCSWRVVRLADSFVFQTGQAAAGFSYELNRTVKLEDRTVFSHSELANTGNRPLVLQWFAHPFFALTHGRATATVPTGTSLPENPGFALQDQTLTFKRRFHGKDDGQFVLLELPMGRNLHAQLNHPLLTSLEVRTNFAPDECPVWANDRTLSIEPYLNLAIDPGAKRAWEMSYVFSAPIHAR